MQLIVGSDAGSVITRRKKTYGKGLKGVEERSYTYCNYYLTLFFFTLFVYVHLYDLFCT